MKNIPILLAVMLTGCASIVSKSTWPVTINSGKIGDRVMIYNRSGIAVQTGETPMTVTLDASSGFFRPARYRIEVSRPGCLSQTGTLSGQMNPWYVGNIVFGGIIGLLIVDPSTGAMWKLPDSYALPSPCRAAQVPNRSGMTVALIDDIPANLKTKLVRVN